MATGTGIEWTEATWNPVAGCTIASPGCSNCYAMRMAHRLAAIGQEKYQGLTRVTGGRAKWNGNIFLDHASLTLPLSWKKGRLIFVNSMSDLFHKDVPLDYIQKVFDVMRKSPQHTYQILTKQADRLLEVNSELVWPNNVWMGVSVELAAYSWRIEDLAKTSAKVKFLSLEPLLGPLDNLTLDSIDWVIVGGESGPGARPMKPEWARSIKDQCLAANVAFHFKQWGGVNKKKTGRILDGQTWDGLPLMIA